MRDRKQRLKSFVATIVTQTLITSIFRPSPRQIALCYSPDPCKYTGEATAVNFCPFCLLSNEEMAMEYDNFYVSRCLNNLLIMNKKLTTDQKL
jgi:hypothetical protein